CHRRTPRATRSRASGACRAATSLSTRVARDGQLDANGYGWKAHRRAPAPPHLPTAPPAPTAPTGPSYRTHRPNRPHRTLPLRGYAIQHPRVRNGFAEVFEAADPGHHAFDAHPEASVRDAAEAT